MNKRYGADYGNGRYTLGPDPNKTYIRSSVCLVPGQIGCWLMVAAGIFWALQYVPNPFAH
jgi:hypothetical protein